jgi:hypothetical protein
MRKIEERRIKMTDMIEITIEEGVADEIRRAVVAMVRSAAGTGTIAAIDASHAVDPFASMTPEEAACWVVGEG